MDGGEGAARQLMPADKRTMVFARRARSAVLPCGKGPAVNLAGLDEQRLARDGKSLQPMAARNNVSAVGVGVGN